MTTIGVISDTHGLLRPQALERLGSTDVIVHAGDIGAEAVLEGLAAIAPVRAIRGNVDRADWAQRYPERDRFELDGWRIYVIHDRKQLDLDPVAEGLDLVISGHSHAPRCEQVDGVWYLNPGRRVHAVSSCRWRWPWCGCGAAGSTRTSIRSRCSLNTPCFLADAMLGRLARWLRALGYDTAYEPSVDDAELVAWSATEQRVLLTRDRHLIAHRRPPRALLIRGDRPLCQLREVIDGCALRHAPGLFERCLVCNSVLRLASAVEAERVPESARTFADSVLRTDPVRCCPNCGRLYWPGSHTRRMRAALATTLPEWVW